MESTIIVSSTPKKTLHSRSHTHPNTQTMVDEAFKVLNTRKCSYRAIKHFIMSTYIVDMRFVLNRIKSYIRESLANGKLIQMSGHGLNGSFRLSAAAKKNPKKFLKKFNKKKAFIKMKPIRKPPVFLITPIVQHRRTSITRFSSYRQLQQKSQEPQILKRSPKPRLAKTGINYSLDFPNDNISPF